MVIPCYNEETQITGTLESIPNTVDHLVVIDDASTDKTREIVKNLQNKDSRIELIVHEVNKGVGAAIASGYIWARDRDQDVAVVMAGDGQMDPVDFESIVDPVVEGRADYSKANRLVSEDSYETIPRVRFWGNSILTLLTKIASGYWHVTDSQSGYTAINKAALAAIKWDKMYPRYGQPNDLLVRLNVQNFRVADVITRPVYGVGEQSKLRIRAVVVPMSLLLLRMFLWRLRKKYVVNDFHPLVFFYTLSAVLFLIGLLLTGRILYLWQLQGFAPTMSSMAWMFCVALGLQNLAFAMWFDMEYNSHLKA